MLVNLKYTLNHNLMNKNICGGKIITLRPVLETTALGLLETRSSGPTKVSTLIDRVISV